MTPIWYARAGEPQRSSLLGGVPAQRRELGVQGRERVRLLLEAALTEFGEHGFHAVRVDDIVRRARSSHGTFYLYFSSKEDVFKSLLRDCLHDISAITSDFPVATADRAGKAALRDWVQRFCDIYAAYAPVMRVLSQADSIGEETWGDGLQMLFRLAEAIATGMTAARQHEPVQRAELNALACVMMLERVNFLVSVGVFGHDDEVADRLTAIIDAAFPAAGSARPRTDGRRQGRTGRQAGADLPWRPVRREDGLAQVTAELIAVLTALAGALLFAIAAVADQLSTQQVEQRPALSPRIFIDLVRQPLWLTAIVANVGGFALQVVALKYGSLAVVEPILICDLIFAVLIRARLKRSFRVDVFVAVIATAAGVAGFLAIAAPTAGTTTVSISVLPELVIGLAVLIGGCVAFCRRNPNFGPIALAVACGLCYGSAAFLVKLVTGEFPAGLAGVFSHWPIYVLIVVGPLGFLLNQDAFQRATILAPVLAIITAADPIVSIGLSLLWLGVTFRSSPAAIAGQVVSLLVMVGGIFFLAEHSPAVSAQAGQVGSRATGSAAQPQLPLAPRHAARHPAPASPRRTPASCWPPAAPRPQPPPYAWTALTATAMFAPSAGKAHIGGALNNAVLRTERRGTLVHGSLATPCWPCWCSTPVSAGGGPARSPPPRQRVACGDQVRSPV